MDAAALKTLALDLEQILQTSSEQEIHTFLAQHPQLFGFLHWDGFIKSKFRLGDSFVPDFLAVGREPDSNPAPPLVTLVEIERANEALFTKSGNPTSFLTHAIKQTQDWKRWITNHRSYLHTTLSRLISDELHTRKNQLSWGWTHGGDEVSRYVAHGFRDRYLIIAGRRERMRMEDRLTLAQMNGDLAGIRVITYDVLLEGLLRRVDQAHRTPLWRDIDHWR